MEYRFLGDTGIQVSSLCMGTMTFGREADKQSAKAIFDRGREAGVNFFDCADIYNAGAAETLLGEFMDGCRDELIITSKVYGKTGPSVNDTGLSRRHIMDAAEASLKRLKTDRIDLYFLHHFDKDTPLEESLRALNDLVTQGKILYAGVSNFSAWQVVKANAICRREGWGRIKCIQPMYNLAKRQAEVELLPMALSEQIGVVCYNPLGAGLLSGKYIDERSDDPGRFHEDDMYKSRYSEPSMHDTAKRFCTFADENGFHPVSLAVAWVSGHPAVTAPIIGARNVEQLEDSLNSVNISMTSELYDRLSDLAPKPPPADDRTEDPNAKRKS